jgi:hypothetical protein
MSTPNNLSNDSYLFDGDFKEWSTFKEKVYTDLAFYKLIYLLNPVQIGRMLAVPLPPPPVTVGGNAVTRERETARNDSIHLQKVKAQADNEKEISNGFTFCR